VLLVMELLQGPSLGCRMKERGRFSEEVAARCVRHILKALFCCHCAGIAHYDISPENFRFQTPLPDSVLKLVDFGLSKRFSPERKPCEDVEHDEEGPFAQERDIWGAGVILFAMLSGSELFPSSPSGGPRSLPCATDPDYVPARLHNLKASNSLSSEALDILSGMLELSTEGRVAAREALMHPFITRFHLVEQHVSDRLGSNGNSKFTLVRCLEALRSFHKAIRLKRLTLLIVAHLLTNISDTVAAIHWQFRFLVRNGHRVEEAAMREILSEMQVEVPEDFDIIFRSADVAGKGGLDYVEFVAMAIITEPRIFCRDLILRSVFRFLDQEDAKHIDDGSVQALFPSGLPPALDGGGLVHEACGAEQMTFNALRKMMEPEGWSGSRSEEPAPWADAPDDLYDGSSGTGVLAEPVLEQVPPDVNGDASSSRAHRNPVRSMPSEVFAVCQRPGFHVSALRPFFGAQPVSNVVLGIVRGTSAYARGAAELGLAEIVEVGGAGGGAFFFMPNPKYHWAPSDAAVVEDPHLRFVAWWIHPDFMHELRGWFCGCIHESGGEDICGGRDCSPAVLRSQSSQRQMSQSGESTLGAPGDFGFSDLVKPPGYLHTYRDMAGQAHVEMLQDLVSGVGHFLGRLLGKALPAAHLSAGFHYPVRPQYSTLHLQLRVNSGDVCGGSEKRGSDLFKLLARLQEDPEVFGRDDETLHFEASLNLRKTLLAAACAGTRSVTEVGPQSLILM